jgi:hypothetical protein
MAITVTQPVVDTTLGGVLIASNSAGDPGEGDYRSRKFLLKNATQTASVFLGPSGVTTANGFQWDPADGPLEVELEPGESLYGIVAVTSQTIHALRQGR